MKETWENSKRLICPSTWKFYRESRAAKNHSRWDFIHGYLYGRWPYLYIGVGKGQHPAAKILRPLFNFVSRLFPSPATDTDGKAGQTNVITDFADCYHAKVMPLGKARKLISVNKPINIPDLEQVIPYKRARSIILENPDHIALLKCPCRASEENPCQPEDVCLVIGEPFASFIVEHHPDKARWASQQEAVDIIVAEDERGHVHHAFFKDAMLNRFYAICNCCSCCCGAIKAYKNGVPMLAASGYVSEVDPELCIGCGTCAEYCQFDAIEVLDGQACVDFEKCMGCGICSSKCVQEAIQLRREPAKGTPLDIHALQD